MGPCIVLLLFFFFNDTATTEIYTLSLHDALPICGEQPEQLPVGLVVLDLARPRRPRRTRRDTGRRSGPNVVHGEALLDRSTSKDPRRRGVRQKPVRSLPH